MLINQLDPVSKRIEARLIRDVADKDDAVRVSEIERCDRPKLLLAGCVPDLQFVGFVRLGHFLAEEHGPHCGLRELLKVSLDVSVQDSSLADACINMIYRYRPKTPP